MANSCAPTPAGWPTTYLEEYIDLTLVFQSQLTSLVFSGALARHTALRVTLLESGFTWLPPWLWRADKDWKGLRRDTPWVKRPPSDYVRKHVRCTIQPVDAPPNDRHLSQVVQHLQSDDLLLFSGDASGLPPVFNDVQREAVLRGNAVDWYRLGS